MENIANIEFLRNRFQRVNNYYGKKGLSPQLSLIRIEENLVNGQGVYNFDLKKENTSAVERNLKRNDLFVTLALGVGTRIEIIEKPNSTLVDFSPRICYPLQSSGTGPAEGAIGFATEDINAMYNGTLYIATGTTVNFNDLPMNLFLSKEDRERIYQYNPSGQTQYIFNGGKKYAFENQLKTMAEEITFSGTQDHVVKVSFPTFATSDYQAIDPTAGSGTNTYQSKIVFLALGYRVVGGTQPQYNEASNPYADCI
jgi:hypothetical protein